MNSSDRIKKEKKNLLQWFWHHPGRNLLIVLFISVFLFILASIGFFEITDSLLEKELHRFDTKISNIIKSYRTETRTNYMIAITHLGDKYFYIPFYGFSLILLLIKKKKLFPYFSLLFASITGHLLNLFLKYIFERPRPHGLHLILVNEASYPSGHAMSSTIFYGFIIFLTLKVRKKTFPKLLVILLSLLLIFLIGFSRVYLGVHYASDILAGQLVGLMWLLLVIMFLQLNIFIRQSKRPVQQ